MRLIEVKSLHLEEFFDQDLPPYAILSHTWGKEEVLFEDMQHLEARRDTIMHKEGFRKIEFLCKTALQRGGLQYVWIDSACIDKSSSAELSEAINSMYKWYFNAEECY